MPAHDCPPSTPPARPVLHDSPFSDYHPDSPSSAASATQAQLERIYALLARKPPVGDAALHLQAQLEHLYALVTAPDTRSRQPADLEDSGLFIEDDSPLPQQDQFAREHGAGGNVEDNAEDPALEELFDVYDSMIKMSVELREGFVNMKRNQTGLMAEVAEARSESRTLKSENVSLRSQTDVLQAQVHSLRSKLDDLRSQNHALRTDLQSDFTELLSLKLQLMAAEVKSAPHHGEDANGVLVDSMERWTDEWHALDDRFRSRTDKFSGAVDANLLGDAHQLAADITDLLNLHDGTIQPENSRHARDRSGPSSRQRSSSPSSRSHQEATSAQTGEAADDTTASLAPDTDENSTTNVHFPEQLPQAPASDSNWLTRLWRPGSSHTVIPQSPITDPHKSIWDSLADATGVSMYDDFYDERNTAD